MNGLMGRARRVLAGLVSAIMFLTSLPMGAPAYAAPIDANESADAASTDGENGGIDEEAVTITFDPSSAGYPVDSITIGANTYEFEDNNDTIVVPVSANEPLEFTVDVTVSPGDAPVFVKAESESTEVIRDETILNKFSFRPTENTTIDVDAEAIAVLVSTNDITATYEAGTVFEDTWGDSYVTEDFDDIKFSLEGTSDSIIGITDVKAKSGNTDLTVTETEGTYTISSDEVKRAVFKEMQDICITATPVYKKESRITFTANEYVKAIKYDMEGSEVDVDMTKAVTASGNTVTYDRADLKVSVTPSDNAILLSDSFKVNDTAVAAGTDGKYAVSVGDAAEIDVKAYRRVGVSANNLQGEDGRDLATIFVDQGATSGLADGDAITFTYDYATGLSDYDVTLAEPVVKYGNTVITPDAPFIGIDGTYTINKSDVEAAIRAGEDIIIEAKGTEIPMAKLTVRKAVSSDKISFIFTERGHNTQHMRERWVSELMNKETVDLKIQKGNVAVLSALDAHDPYSFFKASKGSEDIEPEVDDTYVYYNLGAIDDDTEAVISTAKLEKSKINLVDPKDPDGAKVEMNIPDKYIFGDYISSTYGDLDLGLNVNNKASTVYLKKLKGVKYRIAGGEEADARKTVEGDGVHYYIPKGALREAAFADVSGNRITVTAELERAGFKPQTLTMIAQGGTDGSAGFTVVQNGSTRQTTRGVTDSISTNYTVDLDYDKAATVTVDPKTGFALEKAYLIRKEDLTAAGMDTVSEDQYVKKLTEKLTDPENPLRADIFTPGSNGSIKVTIAKANCPYTLFVTTKDKVELVVVDVANGEKFIYPQNGVYHAYWWDTYNIGYKKGGEWVPLSDETISANNGEKAVTEELFEEVNGVTVLRTLSANSADIYGKTVTVEFATADRADNAEIRFDYSRKPQDGDISFEEGVVSWNAALSRNEIVKSQPLGNTVKYIISNPHGLPIGAGTGVDNDPDVDIRLVDTEKKDGKAVKHELYVTSHAKEGLSENVIRFYDGTYPYMFQTITVKFDTDQVKNADLKNTVTAKADTDSITFDFSRVDIDRSTEGLYYFVSANTTDDPDTLVRSAEAYVPVTDKVYTLPLKLQDKEDEVETRDIKYDVEVKLVQKDAKGDPIPGAATETGKEYSGKVTTISNGVYARKIKLVKAKTAPKVIYGSSASAGKGMDKFLLATVVYPDAAKNVPVTVKRLKSLTLTDSKGTVVDDDDTHRYISLKENGIYLNPKSLPAGTYTLKACAVEPKGVDVTAGMSFTVVNAINKIEVSVPSTVLYRAPGKVASLKATVIYNYGIKSDAPKAKKVKWYLTDDSGHKITPPAGMTFKNGTVKIAKNAVLPENYTFKIYAEAADFDHGKTPVRNYVKITVTNTPTVPAEIYIGDTQITDGAKIESDDLDGVIRVYDQNEKPIYNIKVAVTGVLKKDGRYCWPVNLGKATVTVTTTDGSKKSKKVKFTVDTDEGINGELDAFAFDSSVSEDSYVNKKDASYTLPLEIFGDDDSFVDHSIKLDGFKKVKLKSAENKNGFYKLAATKRNAKITITEKADSSHPTVINVTNTAIPEDSKAAAAKVTASNKLRTAFGGRVVDKKGTIFGNLNFTSKTAYDTVSYNKVKYTVKYGKTPAKKDQKVRLYTTTPEIAHAIYDSDATMINRWTYDVKLGEGGTFVIDYINAYGHFSLNPGTYKIQATPVDSAGYATGKSGTIKVKVVNAPKATVKTLKAKAVSFTGTVSANGEADLNFAKQANILISANGVSNAEFGVKIVDDESKPVDLDLRGLNVKGKINGFAQMFEVTDGGTLKYTGTKPSNYNAKKGISGQIAVTYTAMNGEEEYMYIPITVKGNFR